MADIDELSAALAVACSTGKDMDAWNVEDFPLPSLGKKIHSWMSELNLGRGFQLVRGFPVREYSKEDCELVYWGIGLHMGEAVPQNTDGDLLGHVRDVGADPNAYGVRLYKTRVEQDFHTDGADIIGLFCLRGGRSGGVSRIVSSVTIYNELVKQRPDLATVLRETFPFDTQGQQKPGQQPWFDFPICHEDQGRLRTFFIPWYIRESQVHEGAPQLSADQIACVEMIEKIANREDFYLDMHFEPGDMQFLKNAAILHKRTEYEDWDEPEEKRHLLRLWLTSHQFSLGDEMLRKGIS
ncbi:TauD/TfdA family dioxygenase [Parvibaculaceae bacterium PLY_AMNH_Bact1]|nr:TauD/TfdA family dioxygenase [Parvibaculaceae bacterium PLY_AMNH_Bact1]